MAAPATSCLYLDTAANVTGAAMCYRGGNARSYTSTRFFSSPKP